MALFISIAEDGRVFRSQIEQPLAQVAPLEAIPEQKAAAAARRVRRVALVVEREKLV